ncbi:MAG: sigma 54-interacting transcriptional regulator [Thermodesulfobacteriota bacterium]|nr:sigma 54-interacting transcriptional regulator [Thermodesulfobacteriota bacterium]
MPTKPTHEELVEKVQELQKEFTLGKRLKIEEELRQFEHMVMSIKNLIALVDQNYYYIYVNEAYCEALQKAPHDIIGHPVANVFGREMFNSVLKLQYDQCLEGKNVNFQTWYDFSGWGRRYMDVNYYPYFEKEGSVLAVAVNAHDITEIKQLEMELKESEERFRAFMDNNPASIYIKDQNDRHIYGNPAAFASVGMKPDEFIGSTTRDLFPPEVAERLIEIDRGVLKKNITRVIEEWKDTAAGDVRWRRDIKFPVKLESGKKLLGGIAIDITEIKQNEQKLQKAYNEIKWLKQKLEQENIYLREEIEIKYRHDEIVGESSAIKNILSQAEKVAGQTTCVLIQGETGTGKELLAWAIHKMSPRHRRQMITVNCGALPGTLIESELFGREKGAFTGAVSKALGRFEVADESTLFLDEIGDLPIELQSKLLRVLEEGRFERLGSSKTITVDVRVIAATNYDLKKLVREGRFRKDLFYRLGAFPITMPPLRDRSGDIPMLVWAFIKECGESMGKKIRIVSKRTMSLLQNYPWPGNVRELKNVIERGMILSTGTTLRIDRLGAEDEVSMQSLTLKQVEKDHIIKVLESTGWKVSGKNGAAEILGLKPTTLEARMKKLSIYRPH